MLYRKMILDFYLLLYLSIGLTDSKLKKIRGIENRGKNVCTFTFGKDIEICIPSACNLIRKRACIIVFNFQSNNICEIFEKYFEVIEPSNIEQYL